MIIRDSLYELSKYIKKKDYVHLTTISKDFYRNGRNIYLRKYKNIESDKIKNHHFKIWKNKKRLRRKIKENHKELIKIIRNGIIEKLKDKLIKKGLSQSNKYLNIFTNFKYEEFLYYSCLDITFNDFTIRFCQSESNKTCVYYVKDDKLYDVYNASSKNKDMEEFITNVYKIRNLNLRKLFKEYSNIRHLRLFRD